MTRSSFFFFFSVFQFKISITMRIEEWFRFSSFCLEHSLLPWFLRWKTNALVKSVQWQKMAKASYYALGLGQLKVCSDIKYRGRSSMQFTYGLQTYELVKIPDTWSVRWGICSISDHLPENRQENDKINYCSKQNQAIYKKWNKLNPVFT